MDRFTDGFFGFPVRIYSGFSIEKADEMERIIDKPIEADWVEGWVKIPGQWFIDDKISWHSGHSRGMTIEEIEKSGFDITVVREENGGEHDCTWDMKKFEEELNRFMGRAITKIESE